MRVINRKRWIALAVIALLALGAALAYQPAKDYYVKSKLDPQVELDNSIKKMAQVQSYRYVLKSGFNSRSYLTGTTFFGKRVNLIELILRF